jgi:hypothetical protein
LTQKRLASKVPPARAQLEEVPLRSEQLPEGN